MTTSLLQVRQRLVHEHALHAGDVEMSLQMVEKRRLVGDALDQARFARRDLAR